MTLIPNQAQRAMVALIEACEDRVRTVAEEYGSLFGQGTWDARALRDFATVGLLLPQRSGKSTLLHIASGINDVIVFSSDEEYKEYCQLAQRRSLQTRAVGFDDLPSLKGKKRVWVPDAFWRGPVKEPEAKDNFLMYEKISEASERNYISIILLDSPF